MKTTVTPDGTITVEHDGRTAKAWDGETVAGVLVKAEAERRFTLAVAYPADKADVSVAADGHRDFASKAAVETAAWNFMRNGAAIGLHHLDGTDGSGEVVESYVYRGPDWSIKAADDTECVVKDGDWMVGTVWSEQAWAQIQAGDVGGVSMQGRARRGKASAEKLAGLRS